MRPDKGESLHFGDRRKTSGHLIVVGITCLGENFFAQKIMITAHDLLKTVPAIKTRWIGKAGFQRFGQIHLDAPLIHE